jgi:hypothetical protein
VTALWAGMVIAAALLLQSALSLLLPAYAALLDPFLIITVFVCLTRGEGAGMLVGTAAAWAQDLTFGGQVVGLLGLSRVLLSYVLGHAGRRFLITSFPAQFAALFVSAFVDMWLLALFAALFDVPHGSLSALTLLARATVNATVGALAFQLIEWRWKRETPL